MKKNALFAALLLPFALCLLPLKSLFSQDSGIKFHHNGEWETAITEAKAANKLIFMDAFTTWCGPCKMMTNQVFPNEQVSQFYNANFVNVKMDMEKGEGLELARKFDVRAYPTLLFIDPSGAEIVHRTAGFMAVEAFLGLGKTALDPSKRLSSMDKKYQAGDRDPEFLFNYATAKSMTFDGSAGPIADEYLKTQTDWKTERNLKFVFDFADRVDSEAFKFLCKNRNLFAEKLGNEAVTGKIDEIVSQSIESKPDITLDEIGQIFKNAWPEKAEEMTSRYSLTYFRNRGERENFAAAAVRHYKKYPSKDAEELNEAAWTFFRVVDNPDQLKAAVKWAKKSVKLSPSFYNYDTLASLNYKLKNKKPALKAAQKAIELARATGEDFAPTQELLEKIQAL